MSLDIIKFPIRIGRSLISKISFKGSKYYWEERYQKGGNSGAGSYGELAEFKAKVINEFIKENKINSLIEFGCGDGNQLSLFKVKQYIGLDVSQTAIRKCIEKFKHDKTKSFFIYEPFCFMDNVGILKADLALSLDVIYHLVEDEVFEKYMNDLFKSAKRYVIIYSTNTDENPPELMAHCKNRKFTKWVEKNIKGWKLEKVIENEYKNKTDVDFYIYEKLQQ